MPQQGSCSGANAVLTVRGVGAYRIAALRPFSSRLLRHSNLDTLATASRRLAVREVVILVEPQKLSDRSDYYIEPFSRRDHERLGISADLVQDNCSVLVHREIGRRLHRW